LLYDPEELNIPDDMYDLIVDADDIIPQLSEVFSSPN
jgi:hypothetical protein